MKRGNKKAYSGLVWEAHSYIGGACNDPVTAFTCLFIDMRGDFSNVKSNNRPEQVILIASGGAML